MKVRNQVLVTLGILVAIAAVILAVVIILDGSSGGPVIVIEPDPDPMPNGGLTDSRYWSVAWCDHTYPVHDIGKVYDPPRMSHHLNGIVGVDDIVVTLKHAGSSPIGPDLIGRIDLQLGNDKLSLKRSKKHGMPTWTWNDRTLKAKYGRKATDSESALLLKITDVAIYDFQGKPIPLPGGVHDIKFIAISYDQNPLYGCP
jgi:hypothetical protein